MRDNDPGFRQYNPGWPTNDGRYLSIFPGMPPTGFVGETLQIGVHERKRRKGISEARYVQRIVPDHSNQLWERCQLAWKMRHQKETISKIHEVTRLFNTIAGYSHFFENRIYTGNLSYGNMLYKNFVEALVPYEWWEEEQQHRAERAAKFKGRQTNPENEPRRIASRHLLSGLVYCSAVDGEEHPMHADTVSANAKRSQWDFYICSYKKNSRSKRCQAPRISAEALTEAVNDRLMNDVLTFENLRPIANAIAEELTNRNQDVGARLAATEGRLTEVRAAIGKLMDILEESDYSISIQRRLKEREAEERQLVAEVAKLAAMLVKPKDIPEITDRKLNQFIDNMRATLAGGDVEVARQVLKHFVAKIVVNDKAGTIYYTFPFHDLSRNGSMPPVSGKSNSSMPLMVGWSKAA
ncbi:MAG: recombinase zinc ribbon domain-containing protein [Aggregatilineales bacterium]